MLLNHLFETNMHGDNKSSICYPWSRLNLTRKDYLCCGASPRFKVTFTTINLDASLEILLVVLKTCFVRHCQNISSILLFGF